MSDQKKYYRLADGRLVTVRIEIDSDQMPHNPRENESTGAVIVTWDSAYVSPDKATDLPGEIDGAIDRWSDCYLIVRYARIFKPDHLLYIGALSRTYDGALSIDDNPSPGARYDGIVVVTRESYRAGGGGVPTPDEPRELAAWEVARYSAWATGEVYGYVAEDSDGTEIDSCWGYIGTSEIDYMYSQGIAATGESAEEITEAEYDDAVTRQNADDEAKARHSRSYQESEIYRAIAGTDGMLRVKFYGDKGDSKFLSISPATARKVAALIAEETAE